MMPLPTDTTPISSPATQSGTDLTQAVGKLRNHIYDYAVVDSGIERKFVEDLDTSDEIVVYSKLPQGFLIPTPVGDYNPDWAIAFKEKSVQHIYFVAETERVLSRLSSSASWSARKSSAPESSSRRSRTASQMTA